MTHATQAWAPGTTGVVVMNEDQEEGLNVVKMPINGAHRLDNGFCSDPELEDLLAAVLVNRNATTQEILGEIREDYIVKIRWEFMYEARQQGYAYSQIGEFLGKDHSTIMYGVKRYQEMLDQRITERFIVKWPKL